MNVFVHSVQSSDVVVVVDQADQGREAVGNGVCSLPCGDVGDAFGEALFGPQVHGEELGIDVVIDDEVFATVVATPATSTST